MAGVYIHVPFCVQKCNYCDFLSLPLAGDSRAAFCDLYVNALLKEMQNAKIAAPISTIYIGGGTPTALPPHLLCKILDAVTTHFVGGVPPRAPGNDVAPRDAQDAGERYMGHVPYAFPDTAGNNGIIHTARRPQAAPTNAPECPRRGDRPRSPARHIEITVEANPGTLSRDYLSALKTHGVNRLSMGLQTTKPHLLKALGRLHTMQQFLENYHTARSLGFTNINIDLMFALPGQTMQDWRDTLHEIIALSPQHISAYSLTPAENTPLWHALERGEISLPGDETDREMYHLAREMLIAAGYTHYELSNFAKPGFESRHNIDCWRRVPYVAFGLGAHSFDGKTRRRNTENMDEYLAGHPPAVTEHLSEAGHLSETMILGLRLMEGIPEKDIPQIFAPQVAELTAKGLLTRQNGNICLTPRGMDLANQVFEAFL